MREATTPGPQTRAGRREWIGLAVLALPTLLLAMDQSVLYLALPRLSEDLGASSTQALWIIDIYGFMLAGFLITMGTLGDRIGRRKLLLTGVAAFGLATVLAAYSASPGMLIATRAVMGIAGATLMPSTLALISTMFKDPKRRGVAVALWFSCLMVGSALGPVIGGAMLESLWWGSVFWLGAPVMALLLVLGPVLLPEYRDPAAGRIDLASVVLSLGTILPIIFGIKELAKGDPDAVPALSIVVGVAVGVAFLLRQRHLPNPLLDLRLFDSRAFTAALLILLLGSFAMGGVYLLVSMYLQVVEGLSPLRAGLWLVPSAVAIVVGSMLAPAIAQRVRPAYVIAAGLLVAAVGYFLITQICGAGGLPLLVSGFVLAFFGSGPMGALGTNFVVGSAPPAKAGSAASVSETANHLGIALGIAVLGSLGSAVYRGQLAGPLPAGIPAEAAGAARESITGAVAAAERLPIGPATELSHTAHAAFTAGLNAAAAVGAVLFVGLAVLAVVAFRHRHPGGDSHSHLP
ncbi:MFS transporter [Actinopolymorpha alba]|uniref:MFS transporter n=1 Tax=Actinopolymorpha alba TaxID=533267 RepID=UPI00035F658B|nr:MFS transporter [Actinopolymorpha alba]